MPDNPVKKFEDGQYSEEVGGAGLPRWNRKESGVRKTPSFLPECDKVLPSQVKRVVALRRGDHKVYWKDDYIRMHLANICGDSQRRIKSILDRWENRIDLKESVIAYVEAGNLMADDVNLRFLEDNIAFLKAKIKGLTPLLWRIESEEPPDTKDTVRPPDLIDTVPPPTLKQKVAPTQHGMEEAGFHLTKERAVEILVSTEHPTHRTGDRLICKDVCTLSKDGAEILASWRGKLYFPDMLECDFTEEVLAIFKRGNVQAVFAFDTPVKTAKGG